MIRREEQRLLREANRVIPPTLAPTDAGFDQAAASASFRDEIVDLVRRHPVPALLLGMGLAYLLTRRQR